MTRPLALLLELTALTLVVFALWPGLDLAVSHYFHDGGGFIGHDRPERLGREFFADAPFVVLAGFFALRLAPLIDALDPKDPARNAPRLVAMAFRSAIVAEGVAALRPAARWLSVHVRYRPSVRALVFLVATMAVGPGLIVNLGFKDHSHRPRPVHTLEFGGTDEFRPWYRFDGACRINCSFVSGEAASGFWMVAPASLVPPPLRGVALGAAFTFGAAASLLRIAFGGHYLSDTLLGALITLIVIVLARRLIWPRGDP